MDDKYIIHHSEYSVPARVSYFFNRDEDIIVSTLIEIEAAPCVEISFYVDKNKRHHGNASYVLSGGISRQSRVDEEIHRSIANHLYERHGTLQKRILHAPIAFIAEKLVSLSMPSHHSATFIKSSSIAKQSYLEHLNREIDEGLLMYKTLNRALSLGIAFSDKEEMHYGYAEIQRALMIASRAHRSLSGDDAVSTLVQSHIKPLRKEEKEEQATPEDQGASSSSEPSR